MTAQKTRRMLVVELNGAEKYFLDKWVAAQRLPAFQALLKNGRQLLTRMDSMAHTEDKQSLQISPWITWASVYTGLAPKEHNVIGLDQNLETLQGQFLWDKLNAQGITTGVMGTLASYPVRRNQNSLFYLPESFPKHSDCFPESLKPVQDFLAFTGEGYSASYLKMAPKLFWKLIKGVLRGIPLSTAYKFVAALAQECFKGVHHQRNSPLLHAKVQMDVFQKLYQRYHPEFATLHLNHIAYMQQRYWRAAEPEHYKDKIGDLDLYYFGDVDVRKDHEFFYKDAILDSFLLTDAFLAGLIPQLETDTLLVIMTGLGQQKMDPVDDHFPDIHLSNFEKLLQQVDILKYEILTQVHADATLNFSNEEEASLAAYKLSNLHVLGEYPLFQVQHIKNQLFLKVSIPSSVWFLDQMAWIENKANEQVLSLFEYIQVSPIKTQFTAQSQDNGWMLLYGNLEPLQNTLPNDPNAIVDVTEISDLLLSYFKNRGES